MYGIQAYRNTENTLIKFAVGSPAVINPYQEDGQNIKISL